jgi:hypothetical protein
MVRPTTLPLAIVLTAEIDFRRLLVIDPLNREAHHYIRSHTLPSQIPSRYSSEPAHRKLPPELWSRIASYTPRFHLRTWLSVSSFHREIALSHIFRTLDIYFGEEQQENMHRSMDVFDRVQQDRRFAKRVMTLRIHWAYEEGDMLDVMSRRCSQLRNLVPQPYYLISRHISHGSPRLHCSS